MHFLDGGVDGGGAEFAAVLVETDAVLGRHHAGMGKIRPEQGIQKGRFADIALADDDENKGVVETGDQVLDDMQVIAGAVELLDETGQHMKIRAQF